jgi:hypothetical protein
MNRKLMTIGFLLGIGVLLCSVTNEALAADSISVTRSDGTLDAFAVIPCPQLPDCAPGVFGVRHTAIANNGTGSVLSDDVVGIAGQVCNLISAGWIYSTQDGGHWELHLRFYGQNGTVSEFVWGLDNRPQWQGPFLLATAK